MQPCQCFPESTEPHEGPLPVKFHFFSTQFSYILPCARDS